MTGLRALAARLAAQPWLRRTAVAVLTRLPGLKTRLTILLFSPHSQVPRLAAGDESPAPPASPAAPATPLSHLPEGARQVHANLARALAARRAPQTR